MAFTQFGLNKYKFSFKGAGTAAVEAAAIETATGIAPLTLQISSEPEFIAEAEGSTGSMEAMAVAEDKHSFTLEGYLTDLTKFNEVGLDFTHDGKFFVVTGRTLGKATKEFQKATLTGMSHAGITAQTVIT